MNATRARACQIGSAQRGRGPLVRRMADSSGRGAAQAARPSGGTASCETERAATPREPSSLSAGGSEDMLARAVAAARRNAFAQATERFEELLAAEPAQQKAWITYAQARVLR